MWLFVAEAKDMEPQIRRHLAENEWVVCDRHTMVSGLVYQAEVHGAPLVDAVTAPAHLTAPNRIYILDVPPEVSIARRAQRGETPNALYESEKIDRLTMMRERYRAMVERYPTARIIDGTQTTAAMLKWIWNDLGLPGVP